MPSLPPPVRSAELKLESVVKTSEVSRNYTFTLSRKLINYFYNFKILD